MARTFALILAVVAIGGAMGVLLFSLLPVTAAAVIAIPSFIGLIIATVYFSSRWSAYSAPFADTVSQNKWKDEGGRAFRTVVENAKIETATGEGAGSIEQRVLRVSVYQEGSSSHAKRILIGDDAEFLGSHGDGLWFFLPSRFYARRDGLICVDPRTCAVLFHQPRKSGEPSGTKVRKSSILRLEKDGEVTEFDLSRPVR